MVIHNFNQPRVSGKSTMALGIMGINPSNTLFVTHNERQSNESLKLFQEIKIKNKDNQLEDFYYTKNFISLGDFMDSTMGRSLKKRTIIFDDAFVNTPSVDIENFLDELSKIQAKYVYIFGYSPINMNDKKTKKLMKDVDYKIFKQFING